MPSDRDRSLCRINSSSSSPVVDVLQASVIETSADDDASGAGVFYERAVDDLVVVDEARKLLYCVRQPMGRGQDEGEKEAEEEKERPLPQSAIMAARTWRKKQGRRAGFQEPKKASFVACL